MEVREREVGERKRENQVTDGKKVGKVVNEWSKKGVNEKQERREQQIMKR